MAEGGLTQRLDKLALLFGFEASHSENRCQYRLHPAWPLWICAEKNNGKLFLYGRVRTFGLAGCRTDLHDWMSIIWAINLRMFDIASPHLLDEEGFVGPDEIYARYILFRQSKVEWFSEDDNENDLISLFLVTRRAFEMISNIWSTLRSDSFSYESRDMPLSMLEAFAPSTKGDIYGVRSEMVPYYRQTRSGTSVTDFSKCAEWPDIFSMLGEPVGIKGASPKADLIRSHLVRNALPRNAKLRLNRLKRLLSPDRKEELIWIPCDSHLVGVSMAGLYTIQRECGERRYATELRALRQQQRANETFLGSDLQFRWHDDFHPNRLEDLVFALLNDHPDVKRVKRTGHPNEPDAGRDLVADVTSSFMEIAQEKVPLQTYSRIVVQCKKSTKNIGKASVTDIRDTVENHAAAGFLLVVFPGVTRPLLDYIETIRERRLFWIDVWSLAEVEALLRANPRIAPSFPDVVSVDQASSCLTQS